MPVFTLFGVNGFCLKAANEICYMKQFKLGKALLCSVRCQLCMSEKSESSLNMWKLNRKVYLSMSTLTS